MNTKVFNHSEHWEVHDAEDIQQYHVILEHPSPCNINGHSEIVKLSTFKADYCYGTRRKESALTDKLIECLGPLLAPYLVSVPVLCLLWVKG